MKGGDTRDKAAASGKKVGRPAKEKIALPVLTKQLAIDLYSDKSTKKRWQALRDATIPTRDPKLTPLPDWTLRFRVETEIQDQATGKPVQPVDHNPQNQPLRMQVTVEHIGARASHPSSAKAK